MGKKCINVNCSATVRTTGLNYVFFFHFIELHLAWTTSKMWSSWWLNKIQKNTIILIKYSLSIHYTSHSIDIWDCLKITSHHRPVTLSISKIVFEHFQNLIGNRTDMCSNHHVYLVLDLFWDSFILLFFTLTLIFKNDWPATTEFIINKWGNRLGLYISWYISLENMVYCSISTLKLQCLYM